MPEQQFNMPPGTSYLNMLLVAYQRNIFQENNFTCVRVLSNLYHEINIAGCSSDHTRVAFSSEEVNFHEASKNIDVGRSVQRPGRYDITYVQP